VSGARGKRSEKSIKRRKTDQRISPERAQRSQVGARFIAPSKRDTGHTDGEHFVLEFSDVAVAHAIQLAVAPVFLLTGISAILAVMTNRLGRIIDRARVLEAKLDGAAAEILTGLRADLAILSRRAKLINRAITLCTTTALLVCTVIAILFLSASLRFDASLSVALLFIAAMSTFFFALVWFLREIYLATVNLRIGPR